MRSINFLLTYLLTYLLVWLQLKTRIIYISITRPIAEGMINLQAIFVYKYLININRNIVIYNKFLIIIAAVAVFVSYC